MNPASVAGKYAPRIEMRTCKDGNLCNLNNKRFSNVQIGALFIMQWNLNLANHLDLEVCQHVDVSSVIAEATARVQDALASVFPAQEVSVFASFDPTHSQQNFSIDEDLRQRCEGIEEGVMARVREMWDL
jgi:hypothetical protein